MKYLDEMKIRLIRQKSELMDQLRASETFGTNYFYIQGKITELDKVIEEFDKLEKENEKQNS